MFVQVIRGRAKDGPGLRKEMDRWREEIGPGAIGFLGSTAGVTEDGQFIVVARFESEAAARKNNERPEQDAWFKEFSTHLDGEPTFLDSTDVEEWMGGGDDSAGFVQIITGSVTDKEKLRAMWQSMDENQMAKMRPDLMGGLVTWDGNEFVQTIYFTSEKEARAGESQGAPPEAQESMNEMGALMKNLEYIDLTEPQLYSP
ncbi:MAG: hypothetical protein ACRDLB_15910 [Actinomycetota bacterium]